MLSNIVESLNCFLPVTCSQHTNTKQITKKQCPEEKEKDGAYKEVTDTDFCSSFSTPKDTARCKDQILISKDASI